MIIGFERNLGHLSGSSGSLRKPAGLLAVAAARETGAGAVRHCKASSPKSELASSPPGQCASRAALTCWGRSESPSQQFVGRRAGALKEAEEGEGFLRPRSPQSNRLGFCFSRPARPLTRSDPLCGSGGPASLRPCRACAVGFPDAARLDLGGAQCRAG